MVRVIFGATKWKPVRQHLGAGCTALDFQARVKASLIVQTDGSMKCFKRGFQKNVEKLDLVAWEQKTCSRCQGTKVFSCWSHVAGGRCFKCSGNGTLAKMLVADSVFNSKPDQTTHPLFGKE